MAIIVLVHGSTQNPHGWDLLVPQLGRMGHDVRTVDLPTDRPNATAAVYAEQIAAALPDDARGAIVVAHSASGIFLPLVGEQQAVGRLVYLAAVIPKLGASVIEQVREDKDMLNPAWLGKNPMDDDVAREFLFHDCAPNVMAWALTTRRLLLARDAMMERCLLEKWPDVPCSYIVCTEDRTIQPEWSRRAARERLGVAAAEISAGHCPHVSRPHQLAEILSKLASKSE